MIGLLYIAYPDGCWLRFFIPAEARALPHEGTSALVKATSFALARLAALPVKLTQYLLLNVEANGHISCAASAARWDTCKATSLLLAERPSERA